MAGYGNIIAELEEVISLGSSDRRVETLRKVTDLFVTDSAAYSDVQISLFDDVIGRLAADIETAARAELADRLAPIANAPLDVVKTLAMDDAIAVSRPVLTISQRLDDQTLVAIAQTKGQAHLLAISERASIAPSVTDVLVSRGDESVVRSVAANGGARFSEGGYGILVERAKGDDVLAERVGLRKDIPPHLFRAVLASAKEQVQKKLMAAAASADHVRVQTAISGVTERIATDVGVQKRNYDAAQRMVMLLERSGKLTESELEGFARGGKFEEAVCSLAVLCSVPIEVVERLMLGDRPDPVLILARAAGLTWPTVKALILVRPGAAGSSNAGLEEAFDNYEKLSASTAQRVMRFWQIRQATARAG